MTLTDSHTHLYAEEFKDDRSAMVKRAMDAGVSRFFLPNIDVASIQPMLDLVWEFPENCFPMMGLHPCSMNGDMEAFLFQIRKWLDKRKFYAIGEIGLDYYWSVEFKKQQIDAFKRQLQWSLDYDLPVVIHSRDSTNDIIRIIREMNEPRLKGIFHCFSGNKEQADQIISMGFYLGIGGVLTFKNSGLAEAIQHISLEQMVLETDAPYLAPVPYRGKRNESGYIPLIAQKLAEVKGLSVEEVAATTTANTQKIFGI